MALECRHLTTHTEELLPILRAAEESDERVLASLHDPACAAYAASVDGKVVGAAVVLWAEDDSEVMYIAVLAEERGKGYGKEIMAAVQAALPEHGHTLLVGTANSSLENIAFYQKCGFRMFKVRRDYFDYIQPPLEEHGILTRDMLVLRYEIV